MKTKENSQVSVLPESRNNKLTQSSLIPSFISPGFVKFMLMVSVLFTAIYAKSYTGEYQLIINNHIVGIFYVLFGSLAVSMFFIRLQPWKAVALAFSFVCLLETIQYFRFHVMHVLTQHSFFRFLFGTTFDWKDFVFYGLGAVLGMLSLSLIQAGKWQKYTEVY
jgi:hypothetical protein